MDDRLLARLIAVGRAVFGAACIVAPKVVFPKAKDAPGPIVWMLRCFGIRDLILGIGGLTSLNAPDPDPKWIAYGAAADTLDVVTAVAYREELGAFGLATTIGVAAPAAVMGWKATIGLRRAEAAA